MKENHINGKDIFKLKKIVRERGRSLHKVRELSNETLVLSKDR